MAAVWLKKSTAACVGTILYFVYLQEDDDTGAAPTSSQQFLHRQQPHKQQQQHFQQQHHQQQHHQQQQQPQILNQSTSQQPNTIPLISVNSTQNQKKWSVEGEFVKLHKGEFIYNPIK